MAVAIFRPGVRKERLTASQGLTGACWTSFGAHNKIPLEMRSLFTEVDPQGPSGPCGVLANFVGQLSEALVPRYLIKHQSKCESGFK